MIRPSGAVGEVRLHPPDSLYVRRGKRVFDVLVGSVALVVTLPVQVCVGAIVRARLGSPVLFRQARPGLDEAPFDLVKFRTMTDERDADGVLLPDDVRLTPLGQFLRASSLDELPELYNVVRGHMSLVGPRPLLTRYLSHYSQRQRARHALRPGVTGLAQVTGRNKMTWEDRFELDVEYVQTVCLRLDLKILALTVVRVLRRADISAEGHATMPGFDEQRDS